jgi:hypothetical protein
MHFLQYYASYIIRGYNVISQNGLAIYEILSKACQANLYRAGLDASFYLNRYLQTGLLVRYKLGLLLAYVGGSA